MQRARGAAFSPMRSRRYLVPEPFDIAAGREDAHGETECRTHTHGVERNEHPSAARIAPHATHQHTRVRSEQDVPRDVPRASAADIAIAAEAAAAGATKMKSTTVTADIGEHDKDSNMKRIQFAPPMSVRRALAWNRHPPAETDDCSRSRTRVAVVHRGD